MKNTYKKIILIALTAFSAKAVFASYLTPQTNLSMIKGQIKVYHKSGAYIHDVKAVEIKAKDYLAKTIKYNSKLAKPKKLAIVLDVDETSLTNYKDLLKLDFGGNSKLYMDYELKSHAPAIKPTLDLYKYAIKNNVTVFFITGRPEQVRRATIKNLTRIGYRNVSRSYRMCENQPVNKYCLLYLRHGRYLHTSAITYKQAMRSKITRAGYTIVENIGDQYSDIAGGYNLRTYKYPNYIYYIG